MRTLAIAATLTCLALPGRPQSAPQQPPETLDIATIARIRDEGLNRSHVMEYASGLDDDIGARLTGSPGFERAAVWCIAQLKASGLTSAREESWGDFGMAWTQIGTSLQLTRPSPATFVAQATPWSPPTDGEITAPVILVPEIRDEQQLAPWKGKLASRVVLYGDAPAIHPDPAPPLVPIDAAWHTARAQYQLSPHPPEPPSPQQLELRERVGRFFAAEHAVAVLRTNGEALTVRDDDSSALGAFVYRESHRQLLPSAVVSPDAFGRMARLLAHDVPVEVRLNLRATFGASHVDGHNVIAELPGSDPALKDQIVMLGGHLDSWTSATGATDDGAAVAIALEAMRLLHVLGLQPRRFIRVALWGGEEQGEFGSRAFVEQHFATVEDPPPPSANHEVSSAPGRPSTITLTPESRQLSAYFNVDAGGGRILGIYTEGNDAAASVFRQWAEPLADLGFSFISPQHRYNIDSENFNRVGLPGFEFLQDIRDYDTRTHHTNLDTFERLSPPDLEEAATIMAIFVYNAAQRDSLLPAVPCPTPPPTPAIASPCPASIPTSTTLRSSPPATTRLAARTRTCPHDPDTPEPVTH